MSKLRGDGERDPLTEKIIGSAIEVHRALGPGLLESAYEECLCRELSLAHIPFERQVTLPIIYKGIEVAAGYRIDMLIDRTVVVEIKAVESVMPIHVAQALTYMRLGNFTRGLLLNFHVPVLRDGIRRLVK